MRWKKELVKDKAKRRKYIVSAVVFLIPGCGLCTAQNHWTTANKHRTNSRISLCRHTRLPAIDRANATESRHNTFVLRIHFSAETDEKNPVLFTPDLLHAQSPC